MSVWKLAEIKVMEQYCHYFRKDKEDFWRLTQAGVDYRNGKPKVAVFC
jgi:hypothetical protein